MSAKRTTRSLTEAVAGNRKTGSGNSLPLPDPVRFTIPTPPSVNEIYKNIRGKGGRSRGRAKTKVYKDFVDYALTSIRLQNPGKLTGNVIGIYAIERMSLSADVDNRIKAMQDVIVKAGVIEDDSFITAFFTTWLPKADGLTHVMLLPAQTLSIDFHPSPDGATGGWYLTAPQLNGEPHVNEPE